LILSLIGVLTILIIFPIGITVIIIETIIIIVILFFLLLFCQPATLY